MNFRFDMYDTPCSVCDRPASHVVVLQHSRVILHTQGKRTCAVGNEPSRAEESEKAAA